LLSMRWPLFSATARAIETASTRPSMAIASAPVLSLLKLPSVSDGADSGGSSRGSSPTS
jgi:hypothetical protein